MRASSRAIGLSLRRGVFCIWAATLALNVLAQETGQFKTSSENAGAPKITAASAVVDKMKEYAGEWVLDSGEEDSGFSLKLRGAKLVGGTAKSPDTLELTRVEGDKLVGTSVGEGGQGRIPVTAELSRDGQRIILEFAPPQSEFVTVTGKRVSDAQPADAVGDARKQVDAARVKLRAALGSNDEIQIAAANAALAAAKRKLESLESPQSTMPSEHLGASPKGGASAQTDLEAIKRVQQLPEVIEWQKQMDEVRKRDRGRSAKYTANDDGKSWTVHVFEDVQDENGGHTATFGWYTVEKATGRVTKNE